MRRMLASIWKWSWLLSLPLALVFIFWASSTISNFYHFGLRYESDPINFTLLQSGRLQFQQLFSHLDSLFEPFDPEKGSIPEESRLPSINLFVPEERISKLNENLPHSGFEEVKGGLWNQNRIQEVKVRYRGDFAYHWAFPKKSLRIKTKRKKLYNGMRKFNLIVPKELEQINDYLSYWLSKRLGLITPNSDLVSLSLNGKWQGVYLLVEQLEELTLRRHHLMPGDIYAGELVAKDAFTGIEDANLFAYSSLWEKIAINNHYPATSKKPLEKLIQLISQDTTDSQEDLGQLLDIEEWAKFSVFQAISQSVHYDQEHNWRIYYDPATSKFRPIVWDPMGFSAGFNDNSIINTDLHFALFKNSSFLLARQQALLDFFQSGMDTELMGEFDRITDMLKTYIKSDRGIVVNRQQKILAKDISRKTGSSGSKWPSSDAFRTSKTNEIQEAHVELRKIITDNLKHLSGSLALQDETASYTASNTGNLVKIKFEGNLAMENLEIRFAEHLPEGVTCEIRYWKDLTTEPYTINVTDALSLQGSLLRINTKLLFNFTVKKPSSGGKEAGYPQSTFPAYFEIEFKGLEAKKDILAVNAKFQNAPWIQLAATKEITPTEFKSLDRPVIPKSAIPPEVWQGVIQVDQHLELNRDLIIKPGTKIYLAPGASILLRGLLIAEGTFNNPIKFQSAEVGQKPWGAFVLQGQAANGSRLTFCDFSGGSGIKSDLFEFSAMFSVHSANRIVLKNCNFSDNRITDDMVHAVYSQVNFINCNFNRSESDALDLDISNVSIEKCNFQDSGNDAIDLMDSEVVVIDSIMEGSGDKGLSVGEGSRLLAINNVVKNNVVGIQVKDGSTAALYNLDFVNNQVALDAYKKNWRYDGGGKVFVNKSLFKNNFEAITADKNSSINISDSYVDKFAEPKKKRISIASTVDQVNERIAIADELVQMPEEEALTQNFGSRMWNKVNLSRRGVYHLGYN